MFQRPTEEADAHRITYRHRAQRRHRTVGSTERSAAHGRARLLRLLQFLQSVRATLQAETGITGAGSPLRRSGRRADGPQNQPKSIQTPLVSRERMRTRARPRRMSPYAYDYGACGAALFDIVNVQIWTRRRASAHRQGRFHSGSGAAILLSICRAGLAHRAEHSPRKREAGGSSPPASTTVNAAIVQWQGAALVRRKPAFDPPLRHHHCTRGETADAAASEAAALAAWRFKSSRVHHFCSLRQAAKASVLHTDIPRFESWSEHQTLR